MTRLVETLRALPGPPLPERHGQALAEALGACLAADHVRLVLRLPAGLDSAAGYRVQEYGAGRVPEVGDAGRGEEPAAGREPPPSATIRLEHDGHALGEVRVDPPAAARRLRDWPELLTVTRLLASELRARLCADDAEQMLRRGAAQLADARLRAAGDMERQRYHLERDLHDGAQHHMVALQMSLALVEHHLGAGDRVEAAGHLQRLKDLLASTEEVLHSTATGLLSLPLADHGLVTALAARLGTLDTLTMDIDPLLSGRRYPPEVEATVYLACLEAVSNAHKHVPGAKVTLTLRTSARGLSFDVTDTGPGFDASGPMPLRQLAERLATVGGTLTVRSSPATGTQVSGFVAI
ncbi:sensor histidine kinase [Dactylosporangium sp. CA-233914]|uniref:sensor histidine kinase n=1 Tax=Dactylosporangium sp. CA-233914 TaxID=3239934 RepID=UPI003D906014